MSGPPPTPNRGIVKQVISGDCIVLKNMKGTLEKTISFSSITTPKLGRRAFHQNAETVDEPWAWEAREFVRKKLIGQTITFRSDKSITTTKDYGTVFFTENGATECITELLLKEGLATLRDEISRSTNEGAQGWHDVLRKCQEQAKSLKRGIWETSDKSLHVRNIKWTVDNPINFVDKLEHKPVQAVVEHVRDGSTIRAFLLPDFTYVTVMMCGIRCPGPKLDATGRPDLTEKVEWAEEARKFTEDRLLHRDVEIVLESINNANFVGTVRIDGTNIAEELLKSGLAKCVDWSMAKISKADSDKLKKAEKSAQESHLRLWKDYSPPVKSSNSEFPGTVVEVINGDGLVVKLNDGSLRKVFLASIRPPRDQNAVPSGDDKSGEVRRQKRPLYDIPWMFEAREYLRKKLIGKKVHVTVDYIQPARDSFPEKSCCTVTFNNTNVAEALLAKGLAWLIHHKQTDDQRASGYDALIAAESKAKKEPKGVHSTKNVPIHRVNDICGDPVKAKNLLPHIKRSDRIEALVEFVANGSRLRLFLPKDSHLITFLLSGVEVRYTPGDPVNKEEEATIFTKERCLQRDVEIRVESIDKNGNFCGWLWVDKVNMSIALVEAGLAKIHFSGLNSKYAKELQNAKNTAKARGNWKFLEMEDAASEVIEVEDKIVDRKVDYSNVLVVETNELDFWCQYSSEGSKLNALQDRLAQEMRVNPPLAGSYTPRRGEICAAKYPVDDMWYRAKIEKISGTKVTVLYIDYGNRADISSVQCASLPSSFSDKPYANHYTLAFVDLPEDADYQKDAVQQFHDSVRDRELKLNFEYSDKGINHVTLVDPENDKDIGKSIVEEGFLLVQNRRERRLQQVIKSYQEAENSAQKKRLGMWEYGDVRADDVKEFGMGR